jgi:hypothetical protein
MPNFVGLQEVGNAWELFQAEPKPSFQDPINSGILAPNARRSPTFSGFQVTKIVQEHGFSRNYIRSVLVFGFKVKFKISIGRHVNFL